MEKSLYFSVDRVGAQRSAVIRSTDMEPNCVSIWVHHLQSGVTLDKLFNLSVPQVPYLQNGDISSTYFIGSSRGLHEFRAMSGS